MHVIEYASPELVAVNAALLNADNVKGTVTELLLKKLYSAKRADTDLNTHIRVVP